ncbi:MFS transporter [Anaerobacillus alkaliphilus]|uniref:MFS transporter n=1 Tax=Anaerobacillus alkaliphilus TaxID=1548597 RepID=A0A4Q0VMW2_9BACI|nr:MFS transporter [Anaerobacillus alkaliphilus]RXI96691.1 MFS transporter [Anaerobacillus alkaliphilus]
MFYLPETIKSNERNSIWNGAYSIIAGSLVTGFIPLFAIQVLGASNQQVGLISSLPSLMSILAMIPGAIWINRLETKKKFTAISILAARFFLLLLVFIPFIKFTNQAWILVVLIALMNFPTALATLSWQSFIGDLIPDERRGQFFSQRNKILTIVGMITTFTVGIILNMFDVSAAGPYQIFFTLGFLFGVVEVYYLMKHIEHRRVVPKKETKKINFNIVSKIVSHKPYLYFLICALLFNFGWQMAWPLFNIYQINYAGATAFWVSLFTVANQISQIISYKWWGKYADKKGNSMMLLVAAIGMTTAPILTILSTNLVYLTVVNLWSGTFVAGTTMLLFNQLLKVSPENDRTSYLASYNVIIAGIGFISPQLGVLFLELYGMNVAMSISSVFRLVGGLAFLVVVLYVERKIRHSSSLEKSKVG